MDATRWAAVGARMEAIHGLHKMGFFGGRLNSTDFNVKLILMTNINPFPAELSYLNFHSLRSSMFLATATHNFKWVCITHICLI